MGFSRERTMFARELGYMSEIVVSGRDCMEKLEKVESLFVLFAWS